MADPKPATETAYPVSERSRVRRMHDRASHEREAVYAVLDASPMCHIGYVIDGEPYVTPTLHWREGDRIFWHGSSASRFLKKSKGLRVCLTVSLLDGYVLARSAYNHSLNYRSAMVFGTAHKIEDEAEKHRALQAMTEDYFPGRWAHLRPVTAQEFKATTVLYMDIEEASAKDRTGPPGDPEEAAFPVWAGVIPVEAKLGAPIPDANNPDGVALNPELQAHLAKGGLR